MKLNLKYNATKVDEIEQTKKLSIEKKLNCDGISLLQNNGIVQEIKHYHLHLKPYYNNRKSIEMIKHNKYINTDIEEVYNKIKEN